MFSGHWMKSKFVNGAEATCAQRKPTGPHLVFDWDRHPSEDLGARIQAMSDGTHHQIEAPERGSELPQFALAGALALSGGIRSVGSSELASTDLALGPLIFVRD
jgi:hypothetical protein